MTVGENLWRKNALKIDHSIHLTFLFLCYLSMVGMEQWIFNYTTTHIHTKKKPQTPTTLAVHAAVSLNYHAYILHTLMLNLRFVILGFVCFS